MPRSRRDTVQSVLLIAAIMVGLAGVRWLVTGGPNRPMVPPPAAATPPGPRPGQAPTVHVQPGTRLSLGGRQPIVVDPASGVISRIPADPAFRTVLFRQGTSTVLVSNERAWVVPAGRAGPRRPLGRALMALPALAQDRVWLVTVRYGSPEQEYSLVEVGLTVGGTYTRWTLPYRARPLAVLPSGVLARDVDGDLVIIEPGSGRVRAVLARAATFVDAHGDQVAWVAGRDLHVRDLATGADTVVPPPPGSPSWHALGDPIPRPGCCDGLGAFSPDGRTLALYARLAEPGAPGLAIVDLVRGRAALLAGSNGATPTGCLPCLAWGSNAWLYFFAAGSGIISIGAWSVGESSSGLLPLNLDGALDSAPNALAAN